MFRAGRVDVKGWSSWRQVRRGCMFSAGRYVLWCPSVGAESVSLSMEKEQVDAGRDGRMRLARPNNSQAPTGKGEYSFSLFS